MINPHPGIRGVHQGAPYFCPCHRWGTSGRMPGRDWACPVGRGGEWAERSGKIGGTPCRLARGRTARAGDAREAGAHGARQAPVELSERTGVPGAGCPLILGTTLPPRQDGKKPEGCRRVGVGRPPRKKRGVVWGVLRPSIVGGARVAVVFIGRTYWQNLSGATHTRNVSACRAKRGEKMFRRARPKVGRSG